MISSIIIGAAIVVAPIVGAWAVFYFIRKLWFDPIKETADKGLDIVKTTVEKFGE